MTDKPEPIAVVLVRDETPPKPAKVREVITTCRTVAIVAGAAPQRHLLLKQNANRVNAVITTQLQVGNAFICANKAEADGYVSDAVSAGAVMPLSGMITIQGTGEIWVVCSPAATGFVGIVSESKSS